MITAKKNYLLAWYLAVWSVFLLLLAIMPAQSLEEKTHTTGLVLTIGYVLLSAAVVLFLEYCIGYRPFALTDPYQRGLYSTLRPEKMLPWACLLSVIGLGLHLYDKVFISGIDFSQGIASARHQWIAYGGERETAISSWQSAAGHLFTNFNFAVILLCTLFWEELKKLRRWTALAVALGTMLIYAATMASRSIPFVFLGFLAALMLVRKKMNKRAVPGSRKNKIVVVIVAGLLLAYAFYVFDDRADLSGASLKEYALPFFYELGAKETDGFDFGDTLAAPWRQLFYMVQLLLLYVLHPQWTFDYVLTLPDTPGGSMFNMVYSGLSKLGMETAQGYLDDRAFKGVLLTLPGSAWYDFGAVGFFFFAIFHGVAIFVANYRMSFNATPTAVLVFILVALFSLLSPLTSAANLMVFPFMVIGLLFGVYGGGIRRQTNLLFSAPRKPQIN